MFNDEVETLIAEINAEAAGRGINSDQWRNQVIKQYSTVTLSY